MLVWILTGRIMRRAVVWGAGMVRVRQGGEGVRVGGRGEAPRATRVAAPSTHGPPRRPRPHAQHAPNLYKHN